MRLLRRCAPRNDGFALALSRFALFAMTILFATCFNLSVAQAEDLVKMRIVLVNPSDTKTQVKDIKNYLPREVTMKDVADAGGLDIDYDQEQGLFYVFKKGIELRPLETKAFEIVLKDVWNIPDEELKKARDRTDRVMLKLNDTTYYIQADLIAKTIYGRIDGITRSQVDPTVTRQQHMAHYRENLKILDEIQADIERLEKLVVAVGGPPNLELIEESDVNLKAPSSKTTWVLIFIIMIFVAILSATFYFTWHRQANITQNIFSREKDDSFSEFKKPGKKNE